MIEIGDVAPAFSLVGTSGGNVDTHSLDGYLNARKTAILSFYVFDFHPACTKEWCSFRDSEWLTFVDDVVVLGIGADGVYSHRQYAEEYDLSFPLLSDSDGAVAEEYGVLYE